MCHTGLVGGQLEGPIRCPAVAAQHPGVLLAQDLLGHLVSPGAFADGDLVDGHLVAHEHPQPTPLAVDAPGGLIGGDHL